MPSRREFLRASMAGAGVWGLPGASAHAAMPEASVPARRHVLMCWFEGGWDTLLSLDPRPEATAVSRSRQRGLGLPGFEPVAHGVRFGPWVGDLAAWLDRTAVVRGLDMGTLDHREGADRFLAAWPQHGVGPFGGEGMLHDADEALHALVHGGRPMVRLQVASGLDTHFDDWASQQGPRQRRGFDMVASLVSELARREYGQTGQTWLDRTVVVGFSELGRATELNEAGGRDHGTSNACFAIGGGIRPGVYGPTTPEGPGGALAPEHVMAAVAVAAGWPTTVAPLSAMLTHDRGGRA